MNFSKGVGKLLDWKFSGYTSLLDSFRGYNFPITSKKIRKKKFSPSKSSVFQKMWLSTLFSLLHLKDCLIQFNMLRYSHNFSLLIFLHKFHCFRFNLRSQIYSKSKPLSSSACSYLIWHELLFQIPAKNMDKGLWKNISLGEQHAFPGKLSPSTQENCIFLFRMEEYELSPYFYFRFLSTHTEL